MVSAESLGDTPRSIIVNGKLVRLGKNLLLVKSVNHKTIYMLHDGYTIEGGEDILARDFQSNLYDICLNGNRDAAMMYSQSIDPFTRSVVITGRGFESFIQAETSDVDVNLSKVEHVTWGNLSAMYAKNYYDIFRILLQRALSRHMSYAIKGRLIKGLFQPVIVSTPNIVSPFMLSEFKWFNNRFGALCDVPSKSNDNQRKLDLSCVSMYDYCTAIGSPIVREMDMSMFMLANCLALIYHANNPVGAQEFNSEYERLINETFLNPGAKYGQFFNSLIKATVASEV